MWNAKLILNDIEKINPNFYPNPIDEGPSKQTTSLFKIKYSQI